MNRKDKKQENPFKLFDIAMSEQERGNLSLAIKLYKKILKIKDDYVEAMNNLACIYMEKSKYEEACKHLSRATEISPNFLKANLNLGNAYEHLNEMQEALKCYKKSLTLDPKNLSALVFIGNALRKYGKNKEALNCYQYAAELHPKSPMALFNLSTTQSELGLHSEAIESCKKAIELDPKNPMFITQYKVMLNQQENIENHYSPPDFDTCAEQFDQRMQALKYLSPKYLFKSVGKYTKGEKLRILDIGCGTGLCGKEFKSLASEIHGIDLSKRMLEIAEKKKFTTKYIKGKLPIF